jgi:proteasome lid subunit RPN8/RPN11
MLWLTPEQARTILDHARRDAPNEACGVLLGKGDAVVEVIAARNDDPYPETGFVVAPLDLLAALTRAEQEGLDVVGAYHSHPAGHPIPSERDIREWHYPDAAHVIVGLVKTEPEIAAWRIANGRVEHADLLIQANRPLPNAIDHAPLSAIQRGAIIVAGAIAVAIVLITAFSLLPPPVVGQ